MDREIQIAIQSINSSYHLPIDLPTSFTIPYTATKGQRRRSQLSLIDERPLIRLSTIVQPPETEADRPLTPRVLHLRFLHKYDSAGAKSSSSQAKGATRRCFHLQQTPTIVQSRVVEAPAVEPQMPPHQQERRVAMTDAVTNGKQSITTKRKSSM